MIQRRYKQNLLNILETYYSNDIESIVASAKQSKTDVIKMNQAHDNYNGQLKESCTLHIDLTRAEEDIFKHFRPTTRNEIRRNLNKDEVQYSYEENLEKSRIATFISHFMRFSHAKNFHKDCHTEETYLHSQINDFKDNSLLSTVSKGDTILSEHLYFFDKAKARYMYGISHRLDKYLDIAPSVVSRSNRGLHWYDMQEFKKRGLKIYDLGGIACDTTDKGLLNVRKFKEGFSQNRVTDYYGNIPVSLRGKIALMLKSFIPQ